MSHAKALPLILVRPYSSLMLPSAGLICTLWTSPVSAAS
jgi:hypothetical protein